MRSMTSTVFVHNESSSVTRRSIVLPAVQLVSCELVKSDHDRDDDSRDGSESFVFFIIKS